MLEFFDIPSSDDLDYMSPQNSHSNNSDNASESSESTKSLDSSSRAIDNLATSKNVAGDESIRSEASRLFESHTSSSGACGFD